MKVNPRNVAGFLRCAFSLNKNKELWERSAASHRNFAVTSNARRVFGRVSARHVLVEKRYGIWAGAGSITCEFTLTYLWTQDALYLRKHKEFAGSLQHASFIAKHSERGKTVHPWFLNLLSRWRGAGAARIFDWKTQREGERGHPW